MPQAPRVGEIIWRDLTVPDAPALQSFYSEVVGWTATPHEMGDYADFNICLPDSQEVVTGICHARGENANVPPQWLLYVWVADVRASAERCRSLGGRVLDGPRPMGNQLFCVIQDPAGAVVALMSENSDSDVRNT
jgi:predicted enzyme related to lactoylglutathione lyase